MTSNEIIALQKRVGTKPDGFWGPKSVAATQLHLRRLMPSPNPWPGTSQVALTRFYGTPGDTTKFEFLDVTGLNIFYAHKPVTRMLVNSMCVATLYDILVELTKTPEGRYCLARYAGAYNNRPMRGSLTPSLHARAAAIDLDPARNGFKTHWPTQAKMPITVMETFAKRGWLPAGAFWSRDAMHFQATL
jgi:hypothetical protein